MLFCNYNLDYETFCFANNNNNNNNVIFSGHYDADVIERHSSECNQFTEKESVEDDSIPLEVSSLMSICMYISHDSAGEYWAL